MNSILITVTKASNGDDQPPHQAGLGIGSLHSIGATSSKYLYGERKLKVEREAYPQTANGVNADFWSV